MKYIIVRNNDGKEIPIIFGDELSHKGVFHGVVESLRRTVRENRQSGEYTSWSLDLVSAGFVSGLSVQGVNGESESLRYGPGYISDVELTKSHPEIDLPIINRG